MENKKDLYKQYHEEKANSKDVPQFDLIRFMESYNRSVSFYNSYGLDKKKSDKTPLAPTNSWFIRIITPSSSCHLLLISSLVSSLRADIRWWAILF